MVTRQLLSLAALQTKRKTGASGRVNFPSLHGFTFFSDKKRREGLPQSFPHHLLAHNRVTSSSLWLIGGGIVSIVCFLDFVEEEVSWKGVWNGFWEGQLICTTRIEVSKNFSPYWRTKERRAQCNMLVRKANSHQGFTCLLRNNNFNTSVISSEMKSFYYRSYLRSFQC